MCLIVASYETSFPMERYWNDVVYFVEKFAALNRGIDKKAHLVFQLGLAVFEFENNFSECIVIGSSSCD